MACSLSLSLSLVYCCPCRARRRHWLVDMVPCAAISRMASNQIAKYSAAIGHSLEYELLLFDEEQEGRRRAQLQSKL